MQARGDCGAIYRNHQKSCQHQSVYGTGLKRSSRQYGIPHLSRKYSSLERLKIPHHERPQTKLTTQTMYACPYRTSGDNWDIIHFDKQLNSCHTLACSKGPQTAHRTRQQASVLRRGRGLSEQPGQGEAKPAGTARMPGPQRVPPATAGTAA